jgi:hypothetical protein
MTAFGAVLGLSSQALFFEVMAEKADQPCSTFLLRQCGADDVSLLMFGNGQTLRECFLAGVTKELVVEH